MDDGEFQQVQQQRQAEQQAQAQAQQQAELAKADPGSAILAQSLQNIVGGEGEQ